MIGVLLLVAIAGPTLVMVADAPPAEHWIAGLIALVLLVGVAIAATMSSKRGHRD